MKTAILFSGQGTQHPGMMREVFEQYTLARESFDTASRILGRDIYALTMNASQEELDRTENTQPCLLACELALMRVFQMLGIPCQAALGFSLGEWAALAASGAASEEEAFALVGKRAAAMQRAAPAGTGGMAVVLGKSADDVSSLCQSIGGIAPSNYNCPGNITVAGTAESVGKLMEKAAAQGIMASRIAVSVPSHCILMEQAAKEMRPFIEAADIQKPKMELIMNATGKPAADCTEIRENLIRQLSSPVLFQQSVEYLLESGYETFLEIGPGKALSGMVKRTAKQAGVRVQVLQFNCLEGIEQARSLAN